MVHFKHFELAKLNHCNSHYLHPGHLSIVTSRPEKRPQRSRDRFAPIQQVKMNSLNIMNTLTKKCLKI